MSVWTHRSNRVLSKVKIIKLNNKQQGKEGQLKQFNVNGACSEYTEMEMLWMQWNLNTTFLRSFAFTIFFHKYIFLNLIKMVIKDCRN